MMSPVEGGMRTPGGTGAGRGDEVRAAGLTATVEAARAGDEEAFRSLYRAVQPGLLRYLTVLVGGDAEDLASETWLQIARDLGRFHGDGDAFRAWSVTIARHRAMDHLRQRRRRPQLDAPVEALLTLSDPEDTAARAIEGLTTAEAIALIRTLPRDQAEAVLLRAVVGLDAQSAGRVLGKRAGAVRVAAHRGLRRLAAMLAAAQERPSAGQPAQAGAATPPDRDATPSARDATAPQPAPRVSRPRPATDGVVPPAGAPREPGAKAREPGAKARERGRAR